MASGLVNVMKIVERNEREAARERSGDEAAPTEGGPLGDSPLGPEYRAISSSAVSCLALGVLSVLALLSWWMLLLPATAIVLGLFGLRQIRRRGDELTGAPLAKIGLALALAFGVCGAGRLSYIYATEVPEGYTRINYAPLQPEAANSVEIPESAKALDGQKVFIKGFILQGTQLNGIRTFLLVPDEGSCCFGGDPKLTDRIQVSLADPAGIDYVQGLQKVAGVFRIRPMPQAVDAKGGVLYHVDEAFLR
ncbi:MAG: hypothetical protein DCC68_14500 [Planctomycetota bacterium]|nr:MAG: hypothetical protein DCC68_14500 [Planctomycetota bacterium]